MAASEPFENRSARDALNVIGRDALDARERFVEAEMAIEVDLLSRQMRHPAGRVLETQHQAALEVILGAPQLGVRHRGRFIAAQLLDPQIDELVDRIVGTAGIDGDVPASR